MGLHSTSDIILTTGLANHEKKATYINDNDNGVTTLDKPVHSIAISNVGTAEGTITTPNGGGQPLPVGAGVSFDAGGNDNTFPEGTFEWDSTGTILLIAYTSNV